MTRGQKREFLASAQILPGTLIEHEETASLIGTAENGAALAAMGMPMAMTAGAQGPSHLRWRMDYVRAT
jgi:hypothetical protein